MVGVNHNRTSIRTDGSRSRRTRQWYLRITPIVFGIFELLSQHYFLRLDLRILLSLSQCLICKANDFIEITQFLSGLNLLLDSFELIFVLLSALAMNIRPLNKYRVS